MTTRKILVPTDFSDDSLAALKYAREYAPVFEAEVLITHVLPSPLYPFALETTSVPQLDEQLRAGVKKRLDEMAKAECEHGIRARAIMKLGHPSTVLIETAQEEEVDLIVISSHGHTGLKHLMLGSTTERVLRTARCPVVVVPRPEPQ